MILTIFFFPSKYIEPIKTTITIAASKSSPKRAEISKKDESAKAQSESAKANSSSTVPVSKPSPKKAASPKPAESPKPSTEKPTVNSSTQSQSATKENGTTMNGNTMAPSIPATLNLIKNDKGLLPKAMIKPNVLQHVIDGHVIQEGTEPFPVTRQRLHGGYNEDSDEPPSKRNRNASSPDKPATTPDRSCCSQCGKKDGKGKLKYKPYCSKACTKAAKAGAIPTTQQNGDHKLRLRNGTENGTTNGSVSPKSLPSPTSSSASTNGTTSDSNSNGSSDANSFDNKKSTESTPMEVSTDVDMEQDEPSFLVKWSVEEVCDYIRSFDGYSDCAEEFANHEIDGQALLLLNENHLVQTMNMKLGPALKIMSQIEAIKKKGAPQTEHSESNVNEK